MVRRYYKFHCSISDVSWLRIWSHLLKKSLMENFIFCAVQTAAVVPNLQPSLPVQIQKQKCNVKSYKSFTYKFMFAQEHLFQGTYFTCCFHSLFLECVIDLSFVWLISSSHRIVVLADGWDGSIFFVCGSSGPLAVCCWHGCGNCGFEASFVLIYNIPNYLRS